MTDDFIKQHPLFSHLPTEDIEMIIRMGVCLEKKKGEVIFTQGDQSQDIYLIQEGKVQVQHTSQKGETLTLATHTAGDFFGELELFAPSGKGRSATIIALESTKLIQFGADVFLHCIYETDCGRRMLLFFNRILTQRLRKMDEAYTRLFLEYKGKQHISELQIFRQKLTSEWGF